MAAQRLATRLAVMIARPIELADGTQISMRASIGVNRFCGEPFDLLHAEIGARVRHPEPPPATTVKGTRQWAPRAIWNADAPTRQTGSSGMSS